MPQPNNFVYLRNKNLKQNKVC